MDRNILFMKLSYYGFTPETIRWFQSYFSNRTQRTLVNGILSDLSPIDYGVLQGSLLGPILFLIFINDLSRVPKILKLILYADDTTIYFSSPNLQSLFSTFNSELVYINEWFLKNKLTVNLTKTNYVLFHSSRRSATTSNLILNLGNHPIEEKCSVRFLGVYFDECLTWNRHIEYLSRKLCKYPFLFYTSKSQYTHFTIFQ